jgi:hypothetical protein
MIQGSLLIALAFYAMTVAFDRSGIESPAWTDAYGVVFAAAGALCGWLARYPKRGVRYIGGGALIGAVLWSYLAAVWTFTARGLAPYIPQMNVVEAALAGAGLGAAGGLLYLGLKSLQSSPD